MPIIKNRNRKAPRSQTNTDTVAVGLTLPDGGDNNNLLPDGSSHHINNINSGNNNGSMISIDESKCKRRKRKNPQASGLQVVAGLCFSIFLLIFISGIDFQANKNISTHGHGETNIAFQRHILEWTKSVQPDGSVCRYDGHCGVRSTCTVSGPTDRRGTCEALDPHNSAAEAVPASEACQSACLKELQKDEHFFQEQWPVVDWTESISSEGRPDGCLLVYHRTAEPKNQWKQMELQDKVKWYDAAPSIKEWERERFQFVQRLDPLNDSPTNQQWVAFCFSPCRHDSDCAVTNDPPWGPSGYICVENICHRNPHYWGDRIATNPLVTTEITAESLTTVEQNDEPSSNNTAEMIIVTGATNSYFSGLQNLVASARYWAPRHKIVVYNLGGLGDGQIKEIEGWPNVLSVEWQSGVPASYPNHVHEGKKYAWKPLIVNETVHKYGSIFWMDAGNTIAGPIHPIEKIVEKFGIMLMKGQDGDMKMSHYDTYKWLGYDKVKMQTGPHFSGNTQAYLYPSRYIDSIVVPNAKCALDINCIAPAGSGLRNHRFDQTTISILAYAPKVRLPHYTEYLAATKMQLNPDLSKPSFKFIWTSRQACNFYISLIQNAEEGKQNGDWLVQGKGFWQQKRRLAIANEESVQNITLSGSHDKAITV